MKKFYTYVLYSGAAKQIYIGHSDSIERRLKQHNKGKVASTKPYLPYKLIYSEEFTSKLEAIRRERELKLTQGRRMLKQLIEN